MTLQKQQQIVTFILKVKNGTDSVESVPFLRFGYWGILGEIAIQAKNAFRSSTRIFSICIASCLVGALTLA